MQVNDAGPSQEDSGCPECEPEPTEEELALAGGCSIGGNPEYTSVSFVLVMFAFVLLVFAKRTGKKICFFAAVALLVSIGNFSYALPTQNLRPALGNYDYVSTQDGRLSLPSAKLFWHYEKDPLVINRKPSNDRVVEIIEARHTLHVLAAASWDRFQFGFDLPVVLGQEQWPYTTMQNGVGDLRLSVKARLYTRKTFNLALNLEGTFPTATADLVGEKDGSFSPKVIVSGRLGPVDLATNVGFRFRSDETLNNPGFQETGVGQLFVASVAGRVPLVKRGKLGLNFFSDFMLATTLSSVTQEEVPIEWLIGFQATLPKGFNFTVGYGASLTRGVGSPQPRVFAGLGWNWENCKACKTVEVVKYKLKKVYVPFPIVRDRIVVIPPIYFDTDKATLRPKSKKTLDRVVSILRSAKNNIKKLRIEGYCDHRASKRYNMKLSKRRTQAAVDYLKDRGISVELFETRHHGENYRVDKTKTKDGMQLNRRVELFVTAVE